MSQQALDQLTNAEKILQVENRNHIISTKIRVVTTTAISVINYNAYLNE